MSAIFISHSSRDDDAARALRERLSQILAQEPYQHTILLDETGIQAGNLWRPKLYRWLAECGGAVLMLTEQALASDWVRKEAAILLWRQALGSRVIVVPLLIGVTKTRSRRPSPPSRYSSASTSRSRTATKPARCSRRSPRRSAGRRT